MKKHVGVAAMFLSMGFGPLGALQDPQVPPAPRKGTLDRTDPTKLKFSIPWATHEHLKTREARDAFGGGRIIEQARDEAWSIAGKLATSEGTLVWSIQCQKGVCSGILETRPPEAGSPTLLRMAIDKWGAGLNLSEPQQEQIRNLENEAKRDLATVEGDWLRFKKLQNPSDDDILDFIHLLRETSNRQALFERSLIRDVLTPAQRLILRKADGLDLSLRWLLEGDVSFGSSSRGKDKASNIFEYLWDKRKEVVETQTLSYRGATALKLVQAMKLTLESRGWKVEVDLPPEMDVDELSGEITSTRTFILTGDGKREDGSTEDPQDTVRQVLLEDLAATLKLRIVKLGERHVKITPEAQGKAPVETK